MNNSYDIGIQEDFDSMTEELGTTFIIYHRDYSKTHAGQEGEETEEGFKYTERGSIQELDTKHEMISSGQMNVGDVKLTFKSDTIIEEEFIVSTDDREYKVLELTKVRGMSNNNVLYVKAFGKKVPRR